MQRVLHPSEPVSQYRCMNLPKTDDNNRTDKNDATTHLDIWPMLLSGQMPHTTRAIIQMYEPSQN